MSRTVDINSLQLQLYKSLQPSGWAHILRSFVLSGDFTSILEQLFEMTQDEKRFTPVIKDIFGAFYACPYSELCAVFVNRDPFNAFSQSSGIAFDCSRREKEHYETMQIFDAIQRTVYIDEPYSRDMNLTRWANQGILLLNANLTVEINKSCTHTQLWKPFTAFLLDTLNIYNPGLHFVFFGKEVKNLSNNINIKRQYKYYVEHPATAAQNKGVWDSANIFPILSKSIQKNFKKTIVW